MKCIEKKECSVCAYYRWDVQICKHDVCTYQMCRRCIFLYGRNKPCPACRRSDAFKIAQCRMYRCDKILYSPHVECVCTFVFFPILSVFAISVIGNMILYMFVPNCCMYRNFAEFVLGGIMIMVPLICLIMCFCECCKDDT